MADRQIFQLDEAKPNAPYVLPVQKSDGSTEVEMMPILSLLTGMGNVKMQAIIPGTGSPTYVGAAVTTAGSIKFTARHITPTFFGQFTRLGWGLNPATASQTFSARTGSSVATRGSVPGAGGFYCMFRVGTSAWVAGESGFFIGLATTTAAAPSPIANITAWTQGFFGIAVEHGDTNWQIVHKDVGASPGTKINLGVNFPANTLSTDMLEVRLFAGPNDSAMRYWVKNLTNGSIAEGAITTNIPNNSTSLYFHWAIANGASGGDVGYDLSPWIVVTPY